MTTGESGSTSMWGGRERGRERLSITDLVQNGTMTAELAAMLWLLVEAKASILVAAGPQFAGKTTVLTAVMDLAPPQYSALQTRGRNEDFSFLDGVDPAATYILVPEISDHTPAYLWGDSVRTLLGFLGRGYSLAATMHADDPGDVVRQLTARPVSVPSEKLHRIEVIVNVLLTYGERDMVRRVNRVTLLEPGPEFVTLAELGPEDGALSVLTTGAAREAVARRTGSSDVEAALAERRAIVEAWAEDAPSSADELRERILTYYASRPDGDG